MRPEPSQQLPPGPARRQRLAAVGPVPTLGQTLAKTHGSEGLQPHIDWAQRFYAEIEPSLTGGAYINYLSAEGKERVQAAYGVEKFQRLRALKDRHDPTNLFRLNQNIPPSSV